MFFIEVLNQPGSTYFRLGLIKNTKMQLCINYVLRYVPTKGELRKSGPYLEYEYFKISRITWAEQNGENR